MDILKLCSLRIEKESVERADFIAFHSTYWSRSDIMRLALWVGLKVVNSGNLSKLYHLWGTEKFKGTNVQLEDVIRAADVLQRYLDGSE